MHRICYGGNIIFEKADVGNVLELRAKNGNISGTVAGSYDDFAIFPQLKRVKAICRKRKTAAKRHCRYPVITAI